MDLGKKKYCIFGTGGSGRETLSCLIDSISTSDYKLEEVVVFMVDDAFYKESEVLGVPVIRRSEFDPGEFRVVVAIGDPKARSTIVKGLPQETKYTSIIHPSAMISEWVEISEGSIIAAGTILTCNITIGKHAHVNMHSTIAHDCQFGDYFTTAPGVNISGNCTFGNCVYFGTNSSSRDGIEICDDVTIGMGGVVVNNIKDKGVYVGNPLRKLLK